MYQEGSLLVYGQNGVCRLVEICSSPFDSKDDRLYYVLKPELSTDRSTIYVPAQTAVEKSRPLMSPEAAKALLAGIAEVPVITVASEKQRKDMYKQVLLQADPKGYLSVLKTVACRRMEAKRAKRHLAATDAEFEQRVRALLSLEISIVLGISAEEVSLSLADCADALFQEDALV